MKVLEPGHVYLLETVDAKQDTPPQVIRFIKRSSSLVQHEKEHEGTNTQELIRVAIDRTKYLDRIQHCVENEDILWCLRRALMDYEARAYRRKVNKVNKGKGLHPEGDERHRDVPFDIKNVDKDSRVTWIEDLPTGPDGHILLEEQT